MHPTIKVGDLLDLKRPRGKKPDGLYVIYNPKNGGYHAPNGHRTAKIYSHLPTVKNAISNNGLAGAVIFSIDEEFRVLEIIQYEPSNSYYSSHTWGYA